MTDHSVTHSSRHFKFGDNWLRFVGQQVTSDQIGHAVDCLRRLLGDRDLKNRSFLDIGCGSGLSMLAALELGASKVVGFDIDPLSVKAANNLLAANASNKSWSVSERSIFDDNGDFASVDADVVHSWGVLHHTGNMWGALDRAASLVKPNGELLLALYRKTAMCGLWRAEKNLYMRAPAAVQSGARWLYKTLFAAGLLASGRSPKTYAACYSQFRGMSWDHDVHDWLGGYPYESVTPKQIYEFAIHHDFHVARDFSRSPRVCGLFGTHCDEFALIRQPL